jgi:hypothetical protein
MELQSLKTPNRTLAATQPFAPSFLHHAAFQTSTRVLEDACFAVKAPPASPEDGTSLDGVHRPAETTLSDLSTRLETLFKRPRTRTASEAGPSNMFHPSISLTVHGPLPKRIRKIEGLSTILSGDHDALRCVHPHRADTLCFLQDTKHAITQFTPHLLCISPFFFCLLMCSDEEEEGDGAESRRAFCGDTATVQTNHHTRSNSSPHRARVTLDQHHLEHCQQLAMPSWGEDSNPESTTNDAMVSSESQDSDADWNVDGPFVPFDIKQGFNDVEE